MTGPAQTRSAAQLGLALLVITLVGIVIGPWERGGPAGDDGGAADRPEAGAAEEPRGDHPVAPSGDDVSAPRAGVAEVARDEVDESEVTAGRIRVSVRSSGSILRVSDVRAWLLAAAVLEDPAARRSLHETRRLPGSVLEDGTRLARAGPGLLSAAAAREDRLLYVETRGATGWRLVTRADAGRVLTLEVGGTDALPVEVVDHAGDPAIGARVTFSTADPDNRFRRRLSDELSVTRPPGGIAYLPLDDVRRFAPFGAFDEDVLTVESAGLHERLAVELPDHEALDQPATLRLPPTGTLEIRTSDPAVAGALDLTAGLPSGRRTLRNLPLANGVATVHHVGLGLELRLAVTLEGESGVREFTVAGPAQAGATAVAEIRFERQFTLTGRLLDEDGEPVTDGHGTPRDLIAFRVNGGRPEAGDGPVLATNRGFDVERNGRFRVVFPHARAGDVLCGVHLRVDDRRAAWVGKETVGTQTVDLGTLRLGEVPLLVAGRVMNARGEPLRNAQVWAFDRHPLDRAAHATSGRAPSKEVMDSWRAYVQACSTTTDHEGRFRLLQGPHMPDPHLVAQTEDHRLEDPVSFRVGDDDVEIVVAGPGIIEVPWIGPPGMPAASVRVEVYDANREVVHESSFPPHALGVGEGFVEPDAATGVARQREIAAGNYTVTLTLRGFEQEPIRVLRGIEVRPGEATRTERVDLRDALRTIPVEAVDEHGAPVEPLDFAILGDGRPRDFKLPRGESAIAAPPDATFELVVSSPGYVSEHVEEVGDRVRVTLRRGIRVTLHMLADVPEVDPEDHPRLRWTAFIHDVREEPLPPSQEIPRFLGRPSFIPAAESDLFAQSTKTLMDAPRRMTVGAAGPCVFAVDLLGRCREHAHTWDAEVRLTAADDGGVIVLETPAHIRELWP